AADRDGPPVPVVGAAPEDGDVEGAAAEVEDGDGAAFGELLAELPGAVGGGRDRFGQELDLAEAGVGGGPLQDRAARRSPVGRVGDGDFGGPQTRAGGLLGDAAQTGGEEPLDRDLPLAEQDAPLVDPTFGVGPVAGGDGAGPALGVTAGVERAVGVEEDPGGQQRRAVEQERARALVAAG